MSADNLTPNTTKRVLIFSTAYLPLIGGAEIAVKEITDRLGDFSAKGGPASGWEFDLICARIKKELPKRESVGRVNVFRLGWGWGKLDKFLLPWRGAALADKLYVEQKYDLIWAIMASFGGLAALFFKNRHPQVPYLLTLQEGDTPKHIARRACWLGPYYKKMFTAADYLTAISQYLFDFGRAQGATASMEIVPNGVDLEKFKPEPPDLDLKNRLGLTKEEKIIITVSRLVPKNGIGDLIEAVKQLMLDDQKASVKLLILGSGPLEKNLKSRVKKLDLENKVLFLGSVPYDEVPKYLNLADVFARPSLSEGLGNVFLEAMACGLPVIATLVGGITDILYRGGIGRVGFDCKVGDPSSIADKIEVIFSLSDEQKKQLKITARKFVEQNYQWKDIAARMKNIFTTLIK